MAEFDIKGGAPVVEVSGGDILDPVNIRYTRPLGGFGALPPYIIVPGGSIITRVNDAREIVSEYEATGIINSVMPLRLKLKNDAGWFTFPLEPLVSLSGKNILIRRNVAKASGKGSVKERWSQDDYQVTIKGVITGGDESKFPAAEFRRLCDILNAPEPVEVDHEIMLIFGIKYLAFESFSFPHTKGLNNQNFELKAYSDEPAELLIKI